MQLLHFPHSLQVKIMLDISSKTKLGIFKPRINTTVLLTIRKVCSHHSISAFATVIKVLVHLIIRKMNKDVPIEKSCANPHYVKQLADKNVMYSPLNEILAKDTFKFCNDTRIWELIDPKGHTHPKFEVPCSAIAISKKSGCCFPGIIPNPKKVCSINCNTCLSYTVFSKKNEYALRNIEYSDSNIISSKETLIKSNAVRTWNLIDDFGHKNKYWNDNPAHIAEGRHCGLPGISKPPKRICHEDCKICLQYTIEGISSIYKTRTIFYSSRNVTPANKTFIFNNEKKIWIHDECGNEFITSPGHIAEGKGCPHCVNKTEKRIRDFIVNSKFEILHNSVDWCFNVKSKRKLPFDVVLKFCIIEVDGLQHFKSGPMFADSNINCHEKQRQRDTYKAWCAWKQGIPIIRIFQEDVYNDHWPEWKDELLKAIELAKKGESS